MSERLNECKWCGSRHSLETVEELNPETQDAKMEVILRCLKCGKEDTYRVMSHHLRARRNAGLSR